MPQKPEDLGQEFHNLTLAVRVAADMDEALDHIARYGSNDMERSYQRPRRMPCAFCARPTRPWWLANASSRFNDGGQLGLGAEIGISTSKLHAYGAMGKELTTTKFVVLGQGQVRQ